MKNCLNLCELLYPKQLESFSLEDLIRISELDNPPQRLYIGSSFCSQYFKHLNRFLKEDYINAQNLPITLTVPIFSQKDLAEGKEAISNFLTNDNIDEITVNDIGMYEFVKNNFAKKINLGRLFFKDSRDIRIPNYNENPKTINLIDFLDNYDNISGIELDLISQKLELKPLEDITVSVHTPYTYQTTGNICKFASITKKVPFKFRPNSKCSLECRFIHEFYLEDFKDNDELDEVFRMGRTVYFLQNTGNLDKLPVDRNIIFPLKELTLLGERD